jgi:hypothetical protein
VAEVGEAGQLMRLDDEARKAKALARRLRHLVIMNAPECRRCGLRGCLGGPECLPRAESFLREKNGNRMT